MNKVIVLNFNVLNVRLGFSALMHYIFDFKKTHKSAESSCENLFHLERA